MSIMAQAAEAAPNTLWTNSNGEICCPLHGGYGLAASIVANPGAEIHGTDMDVWTVWPADMAAATGLYCEHCPTEKQRNAS